jgi:hypothetical protein
MSPLVKRHFDKWIKCGTWHTGHPADQERFYRFVWAVVSFSRAPITEQMVREEILARWVGKFDADYLEQRSLHYACLYQELFDFAKTRNAKRPFITDENGDPIM